jgi:hypothetical protein
LGQGLSTARQQFFFCVADFSEYESYFSCFWHKYELFWVFGWTKIDGCYLFEGTVKQLMFCVFNSLFPFFCKYLFVHSLLSIDAIDSPLFFTHFQHLKCLPVDNLFYITENTERIKKYCEGKVEVKTKL